MLVLFEVGVYVEVEGGGGGNGVPSGENARLM